MAKYKPSLLKRLGWKYERLTDWIRYRTYDKYHIVKTDLEPAYYDKDTILLHVNFSILVDYVEIECAWMSDVFDKKRKLSRKFPRIIRNLFTKRDSRPEGLDFIDWHLTHEYSDEEKSNMGFDTEEKYQEYITKYRAPWQEIRDLYIWWKDVRPARLDEMEESGWSQHCDLMREKYGEMYFFVPCNDGSCCSEMRTHETPEEKAEGSRKALLSHEIEERNHKEDEDMLIRLMKIRRCLWT